MTMAVGDEDESTEEEEIDLVDSDEGSNRNRFREFWQEDLLNPSFRVGQVFGIGEFVRKAITEYCVMFCYTRQSSL